MNQFPLFTIAGKQKVHLSDREMEEVVNVEQMRNQYAQTLENLKQEYIKNLSLRTAVGMLYCLEVFWGWKACDLLFCVCGSMCLRMCR